MESKPSEKNVKAVSSTKQIKRTVVVYAQRSFTAGNYTNTISINITALFNLTVEKLWLTSKAIDSVTSQNWAGMTALSFILAGTTVGRDNPGFVVPSTAGNHLPVIVSKFGHNGEVQSKLSLAAGDILTLQYTFHLDVVPVNTINATGYATLLYECPEDYLSIDSFLIEPK